MLETNAIGNICERSTLAMCFVERPDLNRPTSPIIHFLAPLAKTASNTKKFSNQRAHQFNEHGAIANHK
jgi:hypothetical protein